MINIFFVKAMVFAMGLQPKYLACKNWIKNTNSFSYLNRYMDHQSLFNSIDSVDSTNNYAMGKLHEGMATHGMSWFANEQTAGKGQRGKTWNSQSGKNVLMSILVQPSQAFRARPFFLSSFIAVCCHEFLEQQTKEEFLIKWPNDIYFSDRKAGGILIENVFVGSAWKWAVVGIGININQTEFADESRAISLAQIKPHDWDPKALATQLHRHILDAYAAMKEEDYGPILKKYNHYLFKRNEQVRLKKNFAVFNTTIKEVNESGQLITEDVLERSFNFGGVEWLF